MNEMLSPDCDWYYPQHDLNKMVDKVDEIINNKEKSYQIAFNSQQHALKNYDYSVVGKKLLKTYEAIIKESK